jgi:predicted transcriptional regulator
MKIKPVLDTTPEHLNRLMVRLKLHPNDVAALAGVHRVTVYKWLAGTHAVPISVIRILEMQKKEKK